MKLKLYNTLTRKKEIFKTIEEKKARIYVCGPTVNDVPHVGHARQQISFDILRRYLKFSGYNVKFVSNITDIEDKIIKKANESGVPIEELTEKNYKVHMQDYEAIGVEKPDVQPRATQYVKEMIDLIKKLEDKKYTYIIEDDGVYYDVSKFEDYGKLSHQNIKDLQSGVRNKSNDFKKNPQDFVLWKFSKPNEPSWSSPWGKGRPGWHIECSAMSHAILGLPLDLHGGGQDLIFPHHEDEIAQSEAGYGKNFSNHWMHNAMVNIEGTKMSKSLGNFKTIRDILKEYSGEVIRYFVLSTHYRKPINFSKKELEESKASLNRLKNMFAEVKEDGKTNKEYLESFKKAMDDDLNTPKALQVLWKIARDKKEHGKINTIEKIDGVFGLNLLKKEEVKISKEVHHLLEQREKARKKKEWEKADELRKKIKSLGFLVDDSKEGAKVKKI
ncbi:MAG: cysteine--tRNA ligase [archaeon]